MLQSITYATPGLKTLTFKITYTNGVIKQLQQQLNVSFTAAALRVVSGFEEAEDFVNNNSITQTIPFQGYNETVPTMGKLEYRTYYNNVTNPGFDVNSRKFSIQPKLRKPIIILDGFDPGDGRKIYKDSPGWTEANKSIYELMFYDHDKDLSTDNKSLVQELQSKGFDVTLVNFQNGADFIERNAMALVALLQKENAKLISNGSAEKVSIIGPSMGGLISRYALAYMEKNGIPYNTKLWVSFDSPHLGANIPISVQASLFFLGTVGGSLEASNKFVENFMSPAARQMLIEQMDGYPNNTTFSSSNKNNTHPFRQQFLQNQITNSLPNSNGFPTLTRNIALINGTTNGTKNNLEGASILDVAAFATFNLKAFYLVLKNLGAPNSSIRTFDGRFTTKKPCKIVFTNMTFGICNIDIITWRRTEVNINPRGSMDVVQGGTFNTQGDIKKSLDDNAELQSLNVENRLIAPDHSFIPSVSALAFKNPNFNWAAPLNRNLVCNPNNKEIYFDSYFAAPANEEHVKISADGAKWLVKELEGIPQAP